MLFSSLMACLIIPSILLVKLAVRDKLSPSWHYFIWFILLIRLILPVTPASSLSILNVLPRFNAISFKTSNVQVPLEKDTVPQTGVILTSAHTQTDTRPDPKQILHNYSSQAIIEPSDHLNQKIYIDDIALLIWLTGTISFGIYVLWINWHLLLRIRKNSQDAQESEKLLLDQCKNILNSKSNITLITTLLVEMPGLFGFFRPILLLPLHLSDQITSDELKHIFLHELTHYQRKDFIVNTIMVFLKVIHWFNPLLWYGFYLMRKDCEIACDSRVLSRMKPEERPNYGYTLIHLKQIARLQHIPGIIGMVAKESKLKKRIIMISSFKKSTTKSMAIGTALLILLGLMLLTGAKNSFTDQATKFNQNSAGQMSGDNHPKQEWDSLAKKNARVSLLDIQGQNFAGQFTGKMMIVPDSSKVEVGFSHKKSKPDKTTRNLAEANKAVGAINGGASKTDSVFGPAIAASGIVIHNGNLIFDDPKDDNRAQTIVGLTEKGTMIVGSHTIAELKKRSVKEAVSAGLPLIINGTAQNLSNYFGVYSQTAIGQKEDGTILMLVINGRSKESQGAMLQDIQAIFLKHGANNAALLDGGSLSTMVYQGNIVNKPPAGEQIVASAIMAMP
ncbi:M56 family metallopeptidase [Desulfosporosinus sp. FKA]|uniref:M56 family metallopeptidase n=1 Tax=Desulfosporosinus sp. FKA TaxID=1969834 RepID=UPI00249DB234|nr:M56 family metallopeptidase [Desulfosporosinus sp. FKA]